jgi:hypothetical protein
MNYQNSRLCFFNYNPYILRKVPNKSSEAQKFEGSSEREKKSVGGIKPKQGRLRLKDVEERSAGENESEDDDENSESSSNKSEKVKSNIRRTGNSRGGGRFGGRSRGSKGRGSGRMNQN